MASFLVFNPRVFQFNVFQQPDIAPGHVLKFESFDPLDLHNLEYVHGKPRTPKFGPHLDSR